MKKFLAFSFLLSMLGGCSEINAAVLSGEDSLLLAQKSTKRLEIRLFRSYGNEQFVHLKARVMKPENQRPENPDDSSLINFWRNLTSLSVKEAAGIQVDFTINNKTLRLTSDKEGMLQATAEAFAPLAPGFQTVTAKLAPGQHVTGSVSSEKVVIQASSDTSLGVISDIDDTIKISNVTSKWKALRRLLFSNSYTSEPIPGTSALFQRLEQSIDGQIDGDIGYVSGSPINISPAIYRFMDHRMFPVGAIELKKWGFGNGDDSPTEQINYKLSRLRQIMTTYPKKSFLFFGDSGEKDPEIYRQITQEFPTRVKAIFINNVTQGKPTDPRFQGVNLTNNAVDAALILQQQGVLSAADVDYVRQAIAGKIRQTNP